MLSTAGGGKTNVIGKMNNAKNAMRQKQGGGSKKGGGGTSQTTRTGAALGGLDIRAQVLPQCSAIGGGPGTGRVETSIAAGSGWRGQ
jgi:hypothetical protein